MKGVIKAFDCADHDPIETWSPTDAESVDYWLCCHIGPAGSEGADLFYVRILTRKVADSASANEKRVVVDNYTWASVRSRIEDLISRCEGKDWAEVAEQLGQHFEWEFDNYAEVSKRV